MPPLRITAAPPVPAPVGAVAPPSTQPCFNRSGPFTIPPTIVKVDAPESWPARLLRVFSAPFRKMVRVLEKVVRIGRRLLPCLFPYCRLLRFASVIVVWPYAKGVEIQMLGETQLHIVGHLMKAILC